MEIEYIYPDPNDEDDKNFRKQMKQLKNESNLGCLLLVLFMLGGGFIFLTILPAILVVLGYSILFLGVYIIYKVYLETFVWKIIDKLKR